jgi:H+/Cl- antiporter ClcA
LFLKNKFINFFSLSCAIADKILHWKIFERIRLNDGKRLEILACASAAGVSSSLGTAFGGVLFSIEVTCTTYMVRNLPRAFLTANLSLLVLLVFGIFNQIQLFESIDISLNKEISLLEMIIFAMIGFLSGIFGVLFVMVVEFLVSLRNNFLDKSLSSELISFRRLQIIII